MNDNEKATGTLAYLDTAKVYPSPFNEERRKHYLPEELASLGANMKRVGQIEPAVVRPHPNGVPGDYQLVVGERRWMGAGLEGLQLKVIIEELDDRQVCDKQLAENLHRANPSAVEEACIFADMLASKDSQGQLIYSSMDALYPITGRSKTVIESRMKLLNCPDFLLTAIQKKEIKAKAGEKIGRLHPSVREEAARRALHPKFGGGVMTVVEIEQMIKNDYQITLNNPEFDTEATDVLKPEEMTVYGFKACNEPAPDDGSCARCRHRTGNDPELKGLLADHSGGQGAAKSGISPDICTYTLCYRAKVAETLRRLAVANEASGARTMPAPKVKALLKSWNVDLGVYKLDGQKYVCMDHEPGFEHTGHFGGDGLPTWAELLTGVDKSLLLLKDSKRRETRAYLESDVAMALAEKKLREDGKKSIFKTTLKPAATVVDEEVPTEVATPASISVSAAIPDSGKSTLAAASESFLADELGSEIEEKKRFAILEALFDRLRKDQWPKDALVTFAAHQLYHAADEVGQCFARLLGLPECTPRKEVLHHLSENLTHAEAVGVLLGFLAVKSTFTFSNAVQVSPFTEELCEALEINLASIYRKVEETSGIEADSGAQKSVFAYKRGRAIDDGVEFDCDLCGKAHCVFERAEIERIDELPAGEYRCLECGWLEERQQYSKPTGDVSEFSEEAEEGGFATTFGIINDKRRAEGLPEFASQEEAREAYQKGMEQLFSDEPEETSTPVPALDCTAWPKELHLMLTAPLKITEPNANAVFAGAQAFALQLPRKAFAKITLATDGAHFYSGYHIGIGGELVGSGSSSSGAKIECNFLHRVDAVMDWLGAVRSYFAEGYGHYPEVDKIKRVALKTLDELIAKIPEPWRHEIDVSAPVPAKKPRAIKITSKAAAGGGATVVEDSAGILAPKPKSKKKAAAKNMLPGFGAGMFGKGPKSITAGKLDPKALKYAGLKPAKELTAREKISAKVSKDIAKRQAKKTAKKKQGSNKG